MKLKDFEVILSDGNVIWVDVEIQGEYIYIDKVRLGTIILDKDDLEHLLPEIDEQVNKYLDGLNRKQKRRA